MTLRTLSFGDLQSGIWGTIWDLGENPDADHGEAPPGLALLGDRTPGAAHASRATLAGSSPDEEWQLSAAGAELQITPEGEANRLDAGFDQLAWVRGRFALNGSEHAVDCLGSRAARETIELGRFESLREASAWFHPDLGLTVLAARPRGSASHAEDLITASVFEEGHSLPVSDPRLSTTYTTAGLPARASFELWLEQRGDDADAGEPGEGQERVESYPRRAAGESVGTHGSFLDGPLELYAELFRWHARGREGAGVYALARLHAG